MKILAIDKNTNKTGFKSKFGKNNLHLKNVAQKDVFFKENNVKKEDVIMFLKTKISTLKLKKEKYESLLSVIKTSTKNNKDSLFTMRESNFSEEAFVLFEKIFYREREEFSSIKDEIPIIEKTIEKFEKTLENLEKK